VTARRKTLRDLALVALLSGAIAWILQVSLRAYAGVEPPAPWGVVATVVFAVALYAAIARELVRRPRSEKWFDPREPWW